MSNRKAIAGEDSAGKRRGPGRIPRRNAIFSVLIAFSLLLSVSAATGDILVTGSMGINLTIKAPSIDVNKTNVTYKATTFEWSVSIVNNTTVGTLRVHVNFDQNETSQFLNILALNNTGNTTGDIKVLITKYAKIGPYILNETYTSTINVYINHEWQTPSSLGLLLQNNTQSGALPLYPSDQVSYYIGVIYTMPPDLPPEVGSDLNSLGEYITFTFTFV